MLTALLVPAVDLLDRRGAPRGGAVALVLLSGIAIVGGILTFVVSQFVVGLPGLVDQVTHSIDDGPQVADRGAGAPAAANRSTTRATPRSRRCATTRRS